MTTSGQPVGPTVDGWQPRPLPAGGTLHGRHVRLEALDEAHVDSLYAHTCAPGTDDRWTYMVAGPFADRSAFASYCEGLRTTPGVVAYAIVDQRTGDATGMATYLRIEPAVGCVEVGSIMFGPALSGTRAATEAMYLMAAHAIDELGYRRYEWKCDALNAPSRAAAVRLGFAYEGTFRQATMYKGRNRDTAWYAITDRDWEVLRPAFQAWLADGNFDGEHQRCSLSESTAAARRGQRAPGAAGTHDAVDPDQVAGERTTLVQFLDYYRNALLRAAHGLTDEQAATASCPPSGLTLTGLIRHLAEVERWWFRHVLAGERVESLFCSDENPDGDFFPAERPALAAAIESFDTEVGIARAITASHQLDDFAAAPRRADRPVTLRWILVHMIEEYARHVGHADLLREAIDGRTAET